MTEGREWERKREEERMGMSTHTFLTSEFTAGPSDRILGVSRVMAAGARGGTDAPGPPGAPV